MTIIDHRCTRCCGTEWPMKLASHVSFGEARERESILVCLGSRSRRCRSGGLSISISPPPPPPGLATRNMSSAVIPAASFAIVITINITIIIAVIPLISISSVCLDSSRSDPDMTMSHDLGRERARHLTATRAWSTQKSFQGEVQ